MTGGFIVGLASANELVPRNAAFLWSSWNGEAPPSDAFAIAVDAANQSPIAGRIVRPIYPATYIAKTEELLPTGLAVSPLGQQSPPVYTVGDYVDENPPRAPAITNGWLAHRLIAGSTCEESTAIRFDLSVSGTDDHTPTPRLAYAVYIGSTPFEPWQAALPFVLSVPLGTDDPPTFQVFVPNSWKDSTVYVAVSALDFAGNESPRSNAISVEQGREGEGCACHLQRPRGSILATTLPALTLLTWLRRKARGRAARA